VNCPKASSCEQAVHAAYQLDIKHPLGIRTGDHCYSYFMYAESGHAHHLEAKLKGYKLASVMGSKGVRALYKTLLGVFFGLPRLATSILRPSIASTGKPTEDRTCRRSWIRPSCAMALCSMRPS